MEPARVVNETCDFSVHVQHQPNYKQTGGKNKKNKFRGYSTVFITPFGRLELHCLVLHVISM